MGIVFGAELAPVALLGIPSGVVVARLGARGHSSRIAGVLIASTSAGAIVGAVATIRLLSRVAPLRLATFAFVVGVIPLWLLTFKLPVVVLVLALAVFGAATPLINAPVIGALTMRTPEALRPKVWLR
jgi:hypothetical protein